MTLILSQKTLQSYQKETFRLHPRHRLRTIDQAVEFVNERGFVFFWPNKGILFPSLWSAVAGDRPVPDEHDDPGHITWDWKDKSLGKKFWYYGRVLSGRNAFISLACLPAFYALSPNYGSPTEDYLEQYAAGKLTAEAKTVYEVLLDHAPLDTLDLRRLAYMTSRESDSRFQKALTTLQMDFRILPVGISRAGAWNYAFIYDLTHHHFPGLLEEARQVSEMQAYRTLAFKYLQAVGAATVAQVKKIFRWPMDQTLTALSGLAQQGKLVHPVEVENITGEHFALPSLVYNR